MSKTTDDTQENGRWMQRTLVNDKYTWTVSGVLWNNIKERTKADSSTQRTEPTYIGSKNLFKDYQTFVEWNRQQVGYGLGYDLDADLLRSGDKIYSESTCLLMPSALNRFLQTNNSDNRKNKELPTGIQYERGSKSRIFLRMNILTESCKSNPILLKPVCISRIEELKEQYLYIKNEQVAKWINYLETNPTRVDTRIIESLKRLEFYYENGTRSRWRLNSVQVR